MDIAFERKMIEENKVVAIIRGISSKDILKTVEALYKGGIRCCEVTFDHSSKEKMDDTVKSISMLRKEYDGRAAIGAGTVVCEDDVILAKDAGASFMISPNCNPGVIRLTKRLGLISIPGAFTPSEIVAAYEAGADIVKVFPASNLGVAYIKAVRGPLGYIPMTAVGGVNAENMNDFLKAGCCGVGIGGNLVNKKLISEGKFDEITKLAQEYKVL